MNFLLPTFLLTLLTSLNTFASEIEPKKPLYEVGLAAGVAKVPHYPAADQDQERVIAFPSFYYRGKVLRQDRKGTRARLLKIDNLDIDLSFGAAFNSDSKDNKTRKGMEDLHWMFEMGPRINYTIYETEKTLFEFELPYRFALSSNGQFTRERGNHINPQLDFRTKIHRDFTLSLSHKIEYATETFQDYFYEVKKEDVTENRPAYNAKGGYLGNSSSLSFQFSKNKLFVILGLSYQTYNGAVNEDSPLFKNTNSTSLFFAFNYFFFQSKELVD